MTPPPQTKLMKLVCKRAGLSRAPFRDSSWSKKSDSTEKKSLPLNKTGERFRSKITKLSVAKSWPLIKQVRILFSLDNSSLIHSNQRNGSLSNKFNYLQNENNVCVGGGI